jgi:hypothetical protein
MKARAQVTLIPAESKKLIAKAIVNMPEVISAVKNGIMVLHPSSSTYFIVEEITGTKPKIDVWVCGVIIPAGTCVEMASYLRQRVSRTDKSSSTAKPGAFLHSWRIKNNEVKTGIPLDDLIEAMGAKDFYVKGVNAVDTEGNVGVLVGNPVEGGTIGRVMRASKKKGFGVLFPVGLEKLVPFPIAQAAKEARKKSYTYAMGVDVALWPCKGGTVVNEITAIKILSGADATPIASGGLNGAEGAITMVIHGQDLQVETAINYIERCKGAKLPSVRTGNCYECDFGVSGICRFTLKDKAWVYA